ncbi:MAG: bifunctional 3-(3-hydroxy-phenyl)propionate/3-hydroxycinnamic acid hydroxylase [Acidimicrobiales bacterium]
MPAVETDVLVVGAGPCGATIANLLGVYGTRALMIDRDTGILDYPRAVGIDDESLRTYQAVGLVEELLADILQNTIIRYHTSWGRCFAEVKPSARPFGWPRRNLFLQPLYEATVRRGVDRFDTIDAQYGHELVEFEQDAAGVTALLNTDDGDAVTVRARFLVGADGGRSTVRHLAGIELTGTTAPVKWLVVDVEDDRLDAPYSAVYCDPVQPILMVPLPYRHRRFEFRLQPDDDEEEATRPERVLGLLRARYGSTPMPRVMRSRVYLHHSRIASTFQSGRVFVAGDAAHLQPPFFGQGMNSGIRDATNLAWKLAAVVSGRATDRILDTYDTERRGHATAMVGFATRIGAMYTPRNRLTERVRDLGFRALQLVPGGREYILQMKYKPMPRYTSGIVVRRDPNERDRNEGDRDDPVGRMFMQPAVETVDRRRVKLDDVLGQWWAVVGIHIDPAEVLSTAAKAWWTSLGARFVRVDRARADPDPVAPGTVTVEDVDGAFRDALLARPRHEIVVLRPDRYVAVVCDRGGFERSTTSLRSLLNG